jgi:hypothetical protein
VSTVDSGTEDGNSRDFADPERKPRKVSCFLSFKAHQRIGLNSNEAQIRTEKSSFIMLSNSCGGLERSKRRSIRAQSFATLGPYTHYLLSSEDNYANPYGFPTGRPAVAPSKPGSPSGLGEADPKELGTSAQQELP